MCCFIDWKMSRNERHRVDKRASSSRARSKGRHFKIVLNC